MPVRLRSPLGIFIVLLAMASIGIGCERLVEEIPTPTPIPTPPESNRPKHEVTTGSIVQEVRGLGRIASSQEQELYFKQGGRLFNILVQQGQTVEEGQILAELETGDLKHQVGQARIAVDLAQLRLEKLGLEQLRSEESRLTSAERSKEAAATQLASAEASYAKALADLDKLNIGEAVTLVAVGQSVIAAEAGVKNAEDAIARLMSLPTDVQLRAAEIAVERSRNAVIAAQAQVQLAENALARLERAPTDEELAATDLELESALGTLAAAETNVKARAEALARLDSLPTDVQLIAAQVEVQRSLAALAGAEANVKSAEEALAGLNNKPTIAELKPAEVEVKKAETALWALYLFRDRTCARDSTTNPCNSANAEVTKGELSLTVARDRLETVKAGATPEEIAAATRALDLARQSLPVAQIQQERAELLLAKVRAGATPEEIAAATTALEIARQSLALTQTRHSMVELSSEKVRAGAAPEDVAAAIAALDMAGRSLSFAQILQAEAELSLGRVNAGAAPEEIVAAERSLSVAIAQRDAAEARLAQVLEAKGIDGEVAQKQLASAKAALDASRANYEQTIDSLQTNESDSLDLALQEKQLELAQITMDHLENKLALAQIEAPFGGVIISKSGRDGDLIQPYKSIVGISNPESLVVAVDLSSSDLGKLELGQTAKIVVTALPTDVFDGEVISIPSLGVVATAGQGPASRTVRITYNGPDTVEVGDLVRVTIQVEKKDNVVIVPSRVIRAFAGRRFVRVVTNTGRRQEVDVKIGISDDDFTEIVSGLTAGQLVIEP